MQSHFSTEWGLEYHSKGLTLHLELIPKVWHFKNHCNACKTLYQTISIHDVKLYVVVSEMKLLATMCQYTQSFHPAEL